MLTITLDLAAIANRLNHLNDHDSYTFAVRNGTLVLRDFDDGSLVAIHNPMAALAAMETADAESRRYAMPGLVLGA